MKRRNLFSWLLGLGSVNAAVGCDKMLPFRTCGVETPRERKTDLGIPLQVDPTTFASEHMEVYIDRGAGEVVFEPDNAILEVDVELGQALVWDKVPYPYTEKEIFGYPRTRTSGTLSPDGPRIVHGDFRVRWKNGHHPA